MTSQRENLLRPSFEDWYAYPVVRMLRSSDALGWNTVHVTHSQLQPGRDFYPNPWLADYCLMGVLAGKGRARLRVGTRITHDEYVVPGSLQLVNPLDDGDALWDSVLQLLMIRIPPQAIRALGEGVIQGDPARTELVHRRNFYDPLLWALVTALCDELREANPLGTLYAESVANTLLLHLLARYSNASLVAQQPRGYRLVAGQIRSIEGYIEAHLSEKITLEALAECIHVSVPHFERMFRQTMGCAPYQYVLEQRMERARRLLDGSGMSVYEVGRRCGFANQSHFTRHFTKRYGISPARYRQTQNL